MRVQINMRSLFSVIAIVFFFVAVPAGRASAAGPEAGKQAPSVELPDLAGRTVSLAQYRGQVVLLNFWSTLCGPCTAEMPSLNRLYLALKDRGLQVLSVAIDSTGKPVREFVAKNNIAFTVLLDSEKEVFFDYYAGPGLPATYLINRNGIILEKFSGAKEWDSPEMKNRILQAIKER